MAGGQYEFRQIRGRLSVVVIFQVTRAPDLCLRTPIQKESAVSSVFS